MLSVSFVSQPASQDGDDVAIKKYLGARGRRRWAQKTQGADSLVHALEEAGHRVTLVTHGIEKDNETIQIWKDVKEELAQQDSRYYASLKVDPDCHNPKWANKILNGIDTTYEQRCLAKKVEVMHRFPGLDWDKPKLWYHAFFCPKHSAIKERGYQAPVARGASLWVEADYLDVILAEDLKEAQRILIQRLKATHLLPQKAVECLLAQLFKSHIEKILAVGKVRPGGDVELDIKRLALTYRAEIYLYWRLKIDESQSEEAITNKIVRKFGLTHERHQRVTIDGKRRWIYVISATDIWWELVAARQRALNGTNLLNEPIKEFVPTDSPSAPRVPQWVAEDGSNTAKTQQNSQITPQLGLNVAA